MVQQAMVLTRSPAVLLGIVRGIDMLVLIATGVAAFVIRHGLVEIPGRYWIAVLLGTLIASQTFHSLRLYRFEQLDRLAAQMNKLALGMAVVMTLMIGIMFFTKTSEEFSRVWAGMWIVAALAGFLAVRVSLMLRLRRWRRQGSLTRQVAIVGAGDHGRRLLEHLNGQPEDRGIRIFGVFDDRRSRIPPRDLEGIPILGSVNDLIEHCRTHQVDLVIVALPWSAEQRILELLQQLRQVAVDVQLCPEAIGFRMVDRPVIHLGGVPMLAVFDRPLNGWNYVAKAIEDRVLAALILLLIWPLMVLIAIAVKLDSDGPVLFRQKRYGFNNNEIEVLKFRTMYHDAGERDDRQATRTDPRVTRVGALLRRTSLDELPQFFNVLEGSMSIVGPRPHAVTHNVKYAGMIQHYYGRHRVKPGITGWAQVNGLRGETDTPDKMEKRVAYDLYYIDNWSLLLDLKIIVRTLFVGFVSKNAY